MYLGIDGGQTKTVGIIMAGDGTILAQKKIQGMPYQGELTPRYLFQLSQLVSDLCQEAEIHKESILHFCGGLCGIDTEKHAIEKGDLLSKELGIDREKISLVNDAIIALWAATSNPRAIILQHGTAFTSAIRKNWHECWLFDSTDIGLMYDIRSELIAKVARMIDGRTPATPLKDKVLSQFNIVKEEEYGIAIDYEIVPIAEQKKTVDLIFREWLAGDQGAIDLVENAAADYALMIDIMLKRIPEGDPTIILGGGVLDRAPEQFLSLCAQYSKLTSSFDQIQRPVLKPVYGAALYAAAKKDAEIEPLFHTLCSQQK